MKRTVITVVAAILLLAVPALFATPITGFNTRPTTIYPSGETAIPAILTALGSFAGAPQSPVGMWQIPGLNPNFSPTLQFEYANNAPSNTFGIWTAYVDDVPGSIKTQAIFNGSAVNGDIASVAFNASGWIAVVHGAGTIADHVVDTGGFLDKGINPGFFGFYLGTGAGAKYYTIDALNAPTPVPGGGSTTARALVYHSTDTSNRWALAFEDGTDFDYNDMVVTIESITPVPEPASMFLLGSGLIGAASFLRRRSAARK